ncbi:MAG: proline dehydrogenase [Crocinitomicaceae bacterium]|jgi:proline dehydrogenase|nr:proline dehydrogenase [Crocinitomicaceae bacterium]
MVSFENTEIAFKSKTDSDLSRAYWLFRIIASPRVVKFGKAATNFALKAHLPINGMIKKTIFRQFCGGETIEECEKTIQHLGAFGIGTILDYSVEGKTSPEDFEKTTLEIIATLDKAKNSSYIPFAVFKVTGIAQFHILEKANDSEDALSADEKTQLDLVKSRVERICRRAHEANIPVFIDAEESWIQDIIDRITEDMMQLFNKERAIVFNTIQMYRHDRLDFLVKAIERARAGSFHYGIKLVRGAYMEKERARAQAKGYPSPIQPDKEASDSDYNSALEIILQNINILALCAGTHNEHSSLYLTKLMEKYSISPSDKRIYFAQLLGMSDHISFNLSDAGYNVAKYVPYGPVKEVLPYLLRRADENTSVAGQTGRELGLITKEKNRRKASR